MDLLKQAIAEAKAVKEIAEKNAMSTLTEAFSPQMQSLLSRKIAEEEEIEDEELDLPIEEEEDEMETEVPAETPAETPAPEEVEEPAVEDEEDLDIDEILRELEGEEEMEDEPVMEEEMEDEPAEDEDAMIDEILQEVEDELAAEDDCDTEKEMASENRNLQRKLKEAHKVISIQKNILNEVGVLNAKLLYTTKILGKHDLTESQKLKILEAFDRAKSLRETKLVYSTIVESLRKTPSKTTKRIAEGGSSKPIKTVSKPINEGSFVNKDRWKLLAGI